MGYPDKVLAADEFVVLQRHPHWKRLVSAVLALLIATPVAAFAAAIVEQSDWDQNAKWVVIGVIAVLWLILVSGLSLWPYANWLTTHFVITDRRVMFRHGVIGRSGIDIPLARINSIEFHHGLLDRLLSTGTLVIESASREPLEFRDIPRVEHVHSLLHREVFGDIGTEASDPGPSGWTGTNPSR